MQPRILIVDEKDNIIGAKDENAANPADIYRVSALWLTNSQGEILLAKRALNKTHNPGQWGPAVAGTVEEGEDYETNILKEMGEELGLYNLNPAPGPKKRVSGKYNHFVQWYLLRLDRPIRQFTINREEVAEIKWISPQKLGVELEANPEYFLPRMRQWAELLSTTLLKGEKS